MVSLEELPALVMVLVLTGVIFVAGFIVLGDLGDSSMIDDGCATTMSNGEAAIGNISSGMTSIVEYAPTWGVIIGVAVLLGVVVGAFVYARGAGYL